MSHIPGHWDDNDGTVSIITNGADRAKKKFGRLTLYKDDKNFTKDNQIPFQFLFFNNRYYPGKKGPVDTPIGCHIHLIEFEYQGVDTLYLPLAIDIVDYDTHRNAEESFLKFMNLDEKFLADHKIDKGEAKKVKDKHGIPGGNYSAQYQNKIEHYAPRSIDEVAFLLERSPKKNDKEIKILKQTSQYMQTPSFHKLYAGGSAIKWIQQAVEDELLLGMDDFLGQ